MEEKHLAKLRAYEQQEALLNGRSSYSKTDPDASFMRTKDDHLGTGQLKPCYNIQMGTEDQFILNYTIHQTASDKITFTQHMDDTLGWLDKLNASKPKNVIADGGYGSCENYEYLEEHRIEAFVKYPGFYKERQEKGFKHPFDYRTLYYNEQQDYFVCPMGQRMNKYAQRENQTKSGYVYTTHLYQALNCSRCPMKGACSKNQGNRIIEVNIKGRKYQKAARKRLETLRGKRKRKKRNIEIEAVFGHLKQDRGFRRFLLCSLQGVQIETGLLAIAHNFHKWHNLLQAQRISLPKPQTPMAQVVHLTDEKCSKLHIMGA